MGGKSSGEDPWLTKDPWSNYQNKSIAPSSQPAVQRIVPGPVQASIQEQNTRLDRFEKELSAMKDSQTLLSKQMTAQSKETDQKLQSIENSVQTTLTDFTKMMQKTMQDTMREQAANRDQQMKKNFEELKDLVQKERAKRKAVKSRQKDGEISDDL